MWGPLDDPEFWQPIVARTGHPTLSIKWATALKLLYFSSEDAHAELSVRGLLRLQVRRLPHG